MKTFLGALAVVVLLGAATAAPASACWHCGYNPYYHRW